MHIIRRINALKPSPLKHRMRSPHSCRGFDVLSSTIITYPIDERVRYPDRYLFLDGPPLTGSPDACILSDLADIVVVVAAYGRDSSAQINQAAASLDSNKLAGVVFNQPP